MLYFSREGSQEVGADCQLNSADLTRTLSVRTQSGGGGEHFKKDKISREMNFSLGSIFKTVLCFVDLFLSVNKL